MTTLWIRPGLWNQSIETYGIPRIKDKRGMPVMQMQVCTVNAYDVLGSSDLQVSRLCLGTMTFGKQTDEPEARRILDAAVAGGVTFIDTVDGFPMGMPNLSRTGQTEEIIRRWLKGRRDGLVIATKAGAHLMNAIDGSLRRLGIDYVDLYQMHLDDTSTPLEETLRALDDIVNAGKAR